MHFVYNLGQGDMRNKGLIAIYVIDLYKKKIPIKKKTLALLVMIPKYVYIGNTSLLSILLSDYSEGN